MRSDVTIINHWGAELIISLTSHSYHYHVITIYIFCYTVTFFVAFFCFSVEYFNFFWSSFTIPNISKSDSYFQMHKQCSFWVFKTDHSLCIRFPICLFIKLLHSFQMGSVLALPFLLMSLYFVFLLDDLICERSGVALTNRRVAKSIPFQISLSISFHSVPNSQQSAPSKLNPNEVV